MDESLSTEEVLLLVVLGVGLFWILPSLLCLRIAEKAGRSRWWGLLGFVPVNIFIMRREDFDVMSFAVKIAPFYLLLAVQFLAGKLCMNVLPAHNLFRLLVNLAMVVLLYFVVSFFGILNREERKLLKVT